MFLSQAVYVLKPHQQLRAGGPAASEPHDDFAVAEGIRNAIVEVWAADYDGEMNKWISDSGTSC
jgi:hypothetical protein